MAMSTRQTVGKYYFLSIFYMIFYSHSFCSRHLLRLWPRNEELAWKIPSELRDIWKRLYETATPDNEQFPLEPELHKKTKGGAVYA